MQRLVDDNGAVLVLVALILVVLIGFGAIAVDAGALYQEHRELQNGADAAALAVAEDCASGSDISACNGTNGDWDVTAERYADGNAEDSTTEVVVSVDWDARRVTADATTIDGGNPPGRLTLFFARIFGIQTGDTTARAAVIWGNPASGSINTLPITVSQCEYDAAVVDQGGLIEDPPPVDGTEERVLLFHNSDAGGSKSSAAAESPNSLPSLDAAKPASPGGGKPTESPGGGGGGGKPTEPPGGGGGGGGGQDEGDCPTGPAGHDATLDGNLPGGFGWLVTQDGACQAKASGGIVDENPGNDVPAVCSATTLQNKLLNRVVYLPIFEEVNGLGGSNGQYTLAGYAGFYVTGYDFPGHPDYSQPDNVNCNSSDVTPSPSSTCLRGWFTTGVVAEGEIAQDGGTDYGVKIIALDE